MEVSFAPSSLLLKVIIPAENTSKTIKVDSKIKVCELHERIRRKLCTTSSSLYQLQKNGDIDPTSYGLYWYSDSGPVWLAENSTLKTYNMKNGDSLEYKMRPPSKGPRGTIPAGMLLSSSAGSPRDPMPTRTLPVTPPSPSLTKVALTTSSPSLMPKLPHPAPEPTHKPKSNSWVTSRPGSTYGIEPTTPTRTNSSPSIPNPTAPLPPSSLSSNSNADTSGKILSDLDDLIGEFDADFSIDDIGDPVTTDYSHYALGGGGGGGEGGGDYDNYNTTPSENDNNGSFSFNKFNNDTSYNNSYENRRESPKTQPATNREDTHVTTDYSNIYNKAQMQKMVEQQVNVKVVERILTDALSGIEEGVIDSDMVRMYLTSALTVLRNM